MAVEEGIGLDDLEHRLGRSSAIAAKSRSGSASGGTSAR
jgi:hypothetical protein